MLEKQGHDGVRRLVGSTDLFRNLSAEDQASCAGRFRELHFRKGQILFGRGDAGTQLYLVAEGQIRLAIATPDGRELSFQIAVAGDLIGEIAVLDGGPRSAEATALTPVTVFVIERGAFRELWSAHPGIADAVVTFLCRRLRDVSDRLEAVALYPMEVRLARFLLVALGAHGAAGQAGAAGARLHPERACAAARRQPPEDQYGAPPAGGSGRDRAHLRPPVLRSGEARRDRAKA
jgi:CRP/FNR family transcriptional regulator, cyclic AMP receptor protein